MKKVKYPKLRITKSLYNDKFLNDCTKFRSSGYCVMNNKHFELFGYSIIICRQSP